jgi:hypothetical protein
VSAGCLIHALSYLLFLHSLLAVLSGFCASVFTFSMVLVNGDQPHSTGFGLLRDIIPLRRSLYRILRCNDATVSLGDAPVDRNLKKISHSGGQRNSLNQFYPGLITASCPFGQALSFLGLLSNAVRK